MTQSPLLKRTRARLAKQRQEEQARWTTEPAALQKSMWRWILRIFAVMILIGVLLYRVTGHSFY